MKQHKWKPYLLQILIAQAVGGVSGFLSRTGIKEFNTNVVQPEFTPPAFLFPIVWGILYALMGISAARILMAPPSRERSRGINLYAAQLILNFFWSLIFFNTQRYGFALLWLIGLWILVLGMILNYRKVDPLAAWLQVPYLLWLTFAALLNYAVWQLNG